MRAAATRHFRLRSENISDLVTLEFGEPKMPVRSGDDPERTGSRCRYRKFAEMAGGRELSDLVAGEFGKPKRAVRSYRDPLRLTVGRERRELGEAGAVGIDGSDFIGVARLLDVGL